MTPVARGEKGAFLAFLVGSLLWGCATTTGTSTPQTAAPPAPEPLPEPGELARNWLLPSRITDVGSGQKLEPEALFDRLLPARVIYVAENHDNPHDHAVQLQVIDGLYRRDPSLAIGMEMFKRPFQKWVNDFVSGEIDEAAMLEKTQWSERWGFDYALYKPILDYARAHQIPILALNERDEVTRQVSRQGLASLDPVDRDGIPDLDVPGLGLGHQPDAVVRESGIAPIVRLDLVEDPRYTPFSDVPDPGAAIAPAVGHQVDPVR